MYRPRHFDVDDLARLHSMIRGQSFGTLVSLGAEGLVASHIPFLLDPEQGPSGSLFGHVARANSQWKGFDGQAEVLVTFQGPHAYVSPAWMEGDQNVPTWNYVAVHVSGRPRVIADPDRVRTSIERLVAANESSRSSPWTTQDAPSDFVDGMLRGIVAFDLGIHRIEGKWKLSQNKAEVDRCGAIAGLEAEGGTAACDIAREMRASLE